MSILSEPRRKQRISVDPQNLQWKNDEDKFGRKLMEKMGWNDGDGLGRNRQGNADAVKLKANHAGKGLGANALQSYDSTWISHHDDFADLLSSLNKNKPSEEDDAAVRKEKAERTSTELKSRSIKRRIHYQKFTRAKDITNFSDGDRAAVLGLFGRHDDVNGKKQEEKAESGEEQTEQKPEADDSSTKHTVSQMSVGEYFAAKMAALKAKVAGAALAEVKTEVVEEFDIEEEIVEQYKKEIKEEEVDEEEERARRKREKKEKKRREKEMREQMEVKSEVKEEPVEEEEEMTEEQKKAAKKERKRKRREEREKAEAEAAAAVETEEPEKKKKKKSKKVKEEADSE